MRFDLGRSYSEKHDGKQIFTIKITGISVILPVVCLEISRPFLNRFWNANHLEAVI